MTNRKLRKPAPLENVNTTINRASTTAGVVLLFMAALSGFGYLFAVKGLVTPGNAVKTASKISAHESLFRFGFLSLFVVAALDAVVAWLLFRVFAPVNRRLSAVAAWGRTAYAAIFVVAVSQLTSVPGLLSPRGSGSSTATSQLRTQVLHRINSFNDIWNVGLILFGLYLIALAYLAYRSGFVPRLISVLLGMAGFAYLIDSFTALTIRATDTPLSTVSAAGEFVFALWLIIRGRRITFHTEWTHCNSIVAAREETSIESSAQFPSSLTPTNSNPTTSK
jgi:hypothetical protein